MAMALPQEELRRRIVAAAALHGWGLRQLREELGRIGAQKLLADRMISGAIPQSRANITVLADLLEVPREWFEVEDWRTLIRARAPSREELEDVAREIAGHERALLQERRRRAG